MNYPHRIRLRGPWECRPEAASPTDPPRRVTVPCTAVDIGLPGNEGATLTRRFGYPGKIDPGEHVWLTFADARHHAKAILNGHVLGEWSGPAEFDATVLLLAHNRLDVELATGSRDSSLGEVAMEIRRDAFLRGISARREDSGALHLKGKVAGESGDELELYVLVDKRHAHYEKAKAPALFDIVISPQESQGALIRIELINVSTVWYAVEIEIGL